jgi:periplasmic protein CpxP/Spy
MKSRRTILPLAVLLTMLATLPASAQPSPPQPHRPPAATMPELPPLPPFLHGLRLSEEQQDKLFVIMQEAIANHRGRAKEMRKGREELQQLAQATELDETRARTLADAIGRAQAELELLRVRTDQRIFRLLSAEQRQQTANRVPDENRDYPPPPRP